MSKTRLCVSLIAGFAAAFLYHATSAKFMGTTPSSSLWQLLRGADWTFTNVKADNCEGQATLYAGWTYPGVSFYPASGCASPNVGASCESGQTFAQGGTASPTDWPNGNMYGTGPNCGWLMVGTCGSSGPPVPPTYGWDCTNRSYAVNSSGFRVNCGNAITIVSQATGIPIPVPGSLAQPTGQPH